MVEYDQQNTIVVGDITINTTSSRKDVVNNDKNESISEDNKMQFAERYFDDLKLSDGDDAFGRPSNVWTLKSERSAPMPRMLTLPTPPRSKLATSIRIWA